MFDSRQHLQYLTLHDIQDNLPEVAIIPVGATEPHGLHLPYGNDSFHGTILANRVAERAAGLGAKVLVLPTIPYGVDANQLGFPMAIHVSQRILDSLVTEILDSLLHHGVRKILIFNSHGGNDFAPLIRQMAVRKEKMFLGGIDWWRCIGDVAAQTIEAEEGDHADEMETSVSIHLYGHLCHLERMGDGKFRPFRFKALNEGWVKTSRDWKLLTRDSSCGDPRKATAEKGKILCDAVIERLAPFVAELSAAEIDGAFPFVADFPE